MKRLLLVSVVFFVVQALSAQSVVTEELYKVNKDSVEFLNYEGPHSKFETALQIKGIGKSLARGLKTSGNDAGYFAKYSVKHIIDENGGELLNADIFIIGRDSEVDHIDNVRRILSGYLEEYYSYSSEESSLVAEFVTYYNAFYRKNMDYFSSVYAPKVVENLDPEKAGISTLYRNWPGKTQMLIPLSSSGTKRVSLDAIGNKEVIEDLRSKEDKGIESRKKMVELKEKEIAKEDKNIEEAKKEIAEEKLAVTENKEALPPYKNESVKSETPTEKSIKQKEEAVKAREKENIQRKEDVRQEREQIAKDEKQLIAEKNSSVPGAVTSTIPMVPFLLVDGTGSDLMGRFVLVDSKTGEIRKKSSLDTVRGRRFLIYKNSLIFISGIDKPPKAVRLMSMDSSTLEIINTGDTDVSEDSVLVLEGGSIYAAARQNDKWYVARFNMDLKLQKFSRDSVVPFSPLQFESGKLYVESDRGKILPLDPVSLEKD